MIMITNGNWNEKKWVETEISLNINILKTHLWPDCLYIFACHCQCLFSICKYRYGIEGNVNGPQQKKPVTLSPLWILHFTFTIITVITVYYIVAFGNRHDWKWIGIICYGINAGWLPLIVAKNLIKILLLSYLFFEC